jgi:hypothetical protein
LTVVAARIGASLANILEVFEASQEIGDEGSGDGPSEEETSGESA